MTFEELLAFPALPEPQRARAEVWPRYEDLDQAGRLQCAPAASASLTPVWHALIGGSALFAWCREATVLPILSRLLVEREDGPFPATSPMSAEGGYALMHVPGPAGPERIMLLMWSELRAPKGRAHAPVQGPPVRAARVFAEHVFTAPFAPREERKVRRLGGAGVEPVPPGIYSAPPPERYAEPPEGATAIGPAHGTTTRFGLCHTDSNQHVNSLVYLRLAEEAALHALAAIGETTPRLARRFEIGYRKPFFAGEAATTTLLPYRHGDAVGAAGVVTPADRPDRPSSWVRVTF